MSYYNKCPECGANLDPGEECSCGKEGEKEKAPVETVISMGAKDVKKDILITITV